MGSLTNTGNYNMAKKFLDHYLKVAPYTRPPTVYLSLHTSDPTEAGTIATEINYTGYARAAITFGAASGRTITQSGQVDFPACTAAGATATHWGICFSGTKTTDDLMAYGTFSGGGKAIAVGTSPFVATLEVVITVEANGVFTTFATTLLDFLFRNQPLSVPTNLYIALFSSACSDSALGTELTGNAYTRALCNSWTVPAAASPQLAYNTSAVTFPQATPSAWSAAIHMALLEHISSNTQPSFWIDCNDLTVGALEYARVLAGNGTTNGFNISLT
jgi:hypothetical protein